MIFGIGTDIIQISRIEAALARNGERFAERILGSDEMIKFRQRYAKVEARGVRYLATRFAAKEAFSKALGLGMRMPMTWRAMQTLNAPSGVWFSCFTQTSSPVRALSSGQLICGVGGMTW